jgi:hypothetical protein
MTNLEKLASSVVFIKKAENDSSFLGRFLTPSLISHSNKSSIKGTIGESLNSLAGILGLGKATYYGLKRPTEQDFRKQLDFFKDKGYTESALSTAAPLAKILGTVGALGGLAKGRLAKGRLAGALGGGVGGAAGGGLFGSIPGLFGKLIDSVVTSEDKDRVSKTLAKSPFLTGTSTGVTDLLTAANS